MDRWNRANLELAMGLSQVGNPLAAYSLWHIFWASLCFGLLHVSIAVDKHHLILHTVFTHPCGQGCS